MANWKFPLSAILCLAVSWSVHAQGDPYYSSTWYANPSSAMTWTSSSVMPDSQYGPKSALSGSYYATSPKYFHPGIGYVTSQGSFRSPLRYYDQQYSFGRLTNGSPIDYSINRPANGGFNSLFGTTGIGQIGGLAPVGTPHRPWYFPGSPDNDTEFQYRW